MPPPRSFDYDLLKDLIREHSDWQYHEYATALTKKLRESDPDAIAILPNTVSQIFSRYRDRWKDEGVPMPERGLPAHRGQQVYTELIWWQGIPAEQRMHTYLRKLRDIARMRRGLEVGSKYGAKQATEFEERLRATKQVVDVVAGTPVLRLAKPEELDGTGELIEIVARPPGGYANLARPQVSAGTGGMG